jgi:hypothetical protein
MKRITALAALLVSGIALARADQPDADRCAASLTPKARLIYASAVVEPMPDASLRDLLTARVRSMVISGQIGLFEARSAAEAAADCLRLAHSWPPG